MKAKQLYLSVPNAIWILPKNFEQLKSLDNITYESDYDTVLKIFRHEDIPCSLLEEDKTTYPKLIHHSFELIVLPIITFTLEFLKSNPGIIMTSLNAINLLLERRTRNDPDSDRYLVRSEVVKETKRGVYKKYTYEGPPSAYADFIKMVQNDTNDE